MCLAASQHSLTDYHCDWHQQAALGVVLAAKGYPGNYKKGGVINGLEHPTPACGKIFHGGTRQEQDHIISHGGRVLCITAWDAKLTQAKHQAYDMLAQLNHHDFHYRTDIGHRAIDGLNKKTTP